jgi:2-haloacid dehalogenase
MIFSRRNVLAITAAGAAANALIGPSKSVAASASTIKAVAFDGFPILDPRPVLATGKQMYPENGDSFVSLFQMRLFEYQWLRALGGLYKDFLSIIDDAHIFAAAQLGGEATHEKRARLRDAFLKIKAWPDAANALHALKSKGLRLAFLSNMTADMLNMGLANSGLEGLLDHVLSTDAIKTFKPDPRAYQLGIGAFKLPKEQIAFAAFAGWDAAGAEWFGYPTFWVNRLGDKFEGLDAQKTATGQGLSDLVRFIDEYNKQG